jgi:hypothetical protein
VAECEKPAVRLGFAVILTHPDFWTNSRANTRARKKGHRRVFPGANFKACEILINGVEAHE